MIAGGKRERLSTPSGCRRKPRSVPLAFMRMQEAAKKNNGIMFHTLMHLMRAELFEEAYHRLSDKKACGWDGQSKTQYGKALVANLKDLENRIHQGTYRPAPSRQVLIPKANGKTRPLAISTIEDKIVQKSVKMILEGLYEPLFIDRSLGFRPKRGAHQAVRAVYHLLSKNERPYVVECDLEKFFDKVDHALLLNYLRKRIRDRRFLRLIDRLLKTAVQERSGKMRKNTTGTPQGSVVSPVLANIYLHYALDLWFNEKFMNHDQREVRYADDVFFCFKKRGEAERFFQCLRERMNEVRLTLNEEKSRIVDFRTGQGEVFNLLGFTFYWGKDRKRNPLLKLRTQTEKLRQDIKAFGEWTNTFYFLCTKLLYKWLNRRSQKYSFTGEQFAKRLRRHPLPKSWGKEALNITQGVVEWAI